MGTNPSGGNQRFGAAFLRNACVLFALLLAASNPAWAKTIYVDTGGNDSFDGSSATNQGGGVGPKMTIAGALAIAAPGDVISIEAGIYNESVSVGINNLTFEVRPDGSFTEARINAFTNAATDTKVGTTGATGVLVTNFVAGVNLNSGSLTVGAGRFRVPSGTTITRNSAHGPVSGSFVFGTNTSVTYTGTADVTTGGELPTSLGTGTLSVQLTGGTSPDSPRTLTLATGNLTLGSGTVNVSDMNTAIRGTITTSGTGTVNFAGPGSLGNLAIPTATANFTANAIVENITISGGNLDLNGFTLTVRGNFTRTAGTLLDNGSLAFVGGTTNATFAAGPNFTVQNLTIGATGQAKNLTFTQDVRVTGTFDLAAGSSVSLDSPTAGQPDPTITFASAGTFTANGNITSASRTTGGVVFTVAGATLTGTGTITNIDVVTGGGNITAAGNTTFTGTLSLTNGGINVTGDLSAADPATQGGAFARVLVNISSAATVITGNFNQDNFDYNLDYVGTQNGARVAGTEFDTNDINNLLVDVRGSGTLDASARPAGTIAGSVTVRSGDNVIGTNADDFIVLFPNADVIVNGSVTVDDDARLNTNAGTIRLNGATNSVVGVLNGGGQILLGNGVTVTGSSAAEVASELGNVQTVANATATITGLKTVSGNLLTNTGSTLNLGLVSDAGTAVAGTALVNADGTTTANTVSLAAGDVNGSVTLNGTALNLTSAVEFLSPNVVVNSGVLNTGAFDLLLSNPTANLVLGAGSQGIAVTSTGAGRVIFASTAGTGTLTANGKTIQSLAIASDVNNATAVTVSNMFQQLIAGAELSGAGNVTLMGMASVRGGQVLSGTGVNTAMDLTVNLAATAQVSSLRQTGGLTFTSGRTGVTGARLEVQNLYELVSGTLDLNFDNFALTGAGNVFTYTAGTITSDADTTDVGAEVNVQTTTAPTSGFFEFNGGAAQTYTLASAISIPYLRFNTAAGVTFAGTAQDITVTKRIMLINGVVDTEAGTANGGAGDLVFGPNISVVKMNGMLATGDVPDFSQAGATLNYVYGDLGTATTVNPVMTGTELTGTVNGLAVFDPTQFNRSVTVNRTFRVASTVDAFTADGATDFAVTLASGGTLIYEDLANIAPDVIGTDGAEFIASTYNLEYRNFRGVVVGGNAQASAQEFPATAGTVAALSIRQAGVNGSPTTLQLPTGFNRQVSSLAIRAGRFDINGNTFSVNGDVDFTAGLRMTSGATGTANVSDALVSSAANGTFQFTGSDDASFIVGSNGGSVGYEVPTNINLRINKGMDTTTVTLVGGFLDFAANSSPNNANIADDRILYLDRGILVAGALMANQQPTGQPTVYVKLAHSTQSGQNINRVDRGQGFVIGTETPPGREAYVAGYVIKEFSNDANGTLGTGFRAGRVVYPVGDLRGNYSPLTLDFESNSGAAAQTFATRRVTANFVANRPSGSLGFPIANGVTTGSNVTNYANFYWFIASDPALGSGTQFNVEARAEGYRLAPGENISTLRLVRRETGDENLNAFSLVGNSGSYQNFLIDPTPSDNTNNDEIPVVLVQAASAFLSPSGSIFTFGNQRGDVNPPPPPITNVAQLQVAHLAPNAPSPVDVYVNGVLVADNLSYLTATGYTTVNNVNGTANLTVAIAPGTSTSAAQAVRTVTVPVAQGQSYFVAAVDDGADATAGSAVDVVVRQAGMMSSQPGRTEFFGLNAVAGLTAPAPVDFRVVSGAQSLAVLFRNVAFGQTSGTEVVDANTYGFDVVKTGTTTRLVANQLNLGITAGERGVLAFVGNATDNPLSPSRNKQLVFIRPDGTVIKGRDFTGTEGVALPTEFALKGAFPNPFSSRAAVRFDLPTAGEVSLVVVDMMGREVMRVPATAVAAGANQRIELDGQGLAAGMYFFRLTAATAEGTKVATGQVTLVK